MINPGSAAEARPSHAATCKSVMCFQEVVASACESAVQSNTSKDVKAYQVAHSEAVVEAVMQSVLCLCSGQGEWGADNQPTNAMVVEVCKSACQLFRSGYVSVDQCVSKPGSTLVAYQNVVKKAVGSVMENTDIVNGVCALIAAGGMEESAETPADVTAEGEW